jgi:AraC family transcriptional regulator
MVKWAILFVVTLFVLLGSYLYFYLGISEQVTLSKETRGEMFLVYKEHLGSYYKINSTLETVEAWAKSQNLDCSLTFGEYLDNPNSVDEDRMRSRVGCVLPASPSVTVPPGMHSDVRPAGEYVVGHFKGAPSIGPYKVYPKAYEYIEKEGLKSRGPIIETYKVFSNTIQTEYLFPVTSSQLPK